MTDSNPTTETVSDERLRELAVLAYLGLPDEFRKDVHSALTELQRLRSSGGASGCGHHGYISQSRALEMVAQLGGRKPTETGEYTMGWNTAIEFAVNVLKGIPSTAPEPRAALDELHQMDQDMLGKRSPEPSEQQDAARYRFLRGLHDPGPDDPRVHTLDQQHDPVQVRLCFGDDLDAVVDAAMRQP